MRAVRSSCSVIASRSCMSTWMVTSRYSPILRIGIRSTISPRPARRCGPGPPARDAFFGAPAFVTARPSRRSAIANASASVALVITVPRSTPRWTMVCAICGRMPLMMQSAPIKPRGRDRLEQVLRGQRIHRRHARDVDDRDRRAGLDDALQQVFHHDLRPRAVERADHREREHALPERHDRRRQLHQLLLLPDDHPVRGPAGRARS